MTTIRAALIALLCATQAQADTSTCAYYPEGTTVTLAPSDKAFAQVHIHNRLSPRNFSTCNMTIYNVQITVEYAASDFDDPDWFHVTTPPGYRAEPPSILLDERSTGTVLIYAEAGM